uniref:Secreted protein n=1 Tax=Haptolina ericina TaxID=156174 RepID=A0A7S3AV05_9EUKA|mmetsp:Transcript_33923/g.76804  ORF Transcript_33923/g.76804 Transcript_33923/m.76804 type:complete len:104 (+) Transcript_33923:516-827(+)
MVSFSVLLFLLSCCALALLPFSSSFLTHIGSASRFFIRPLPLSSFLYITVTRQPLFTKRASLASLASLASVHAKVCAQTKLVVSDVCQSRGGLTPGQPPRVVL